ncbi:PHD finger protein 20-like [Chrysemys picta bellii]|uniref:PHD finger protein 20-like n=1 Tax=Chrysemys picta bellii TaxID=8478 RepID=UPI0032B18B78
MKLNLLCCLAQEKLKNSPDSNERDQIRRRSSRLSSNGSPEIINTDLVTTTFAEIGPLKDPASSPKEPEELQLEIPVESDQNACEQAPQSSGDVSQTTPLDVNISLKEEKVDDRELSFTSTETQEPSITVTKTFKRTHDFIASKAATVDQDHKFRCKLLDCSKSFRKAKLLHYHMKYFHGVEKAPEPQQSPVQRNIQTRGFLASEKAKQRSLNRRRTTSGSLCKYVGYIFIFKEHSSI